MPEPKPTEPTVGLTLSQRRKLGLTPLNLAKKARLLKEAGEIDKTTSNAEIAAALANSCCEGLPANEVAALDWDAIIAFIERLIPLIKLLIMLL